MHFFENKFSKDYPVKPDNDITFKPKDNTFYAQLLPTFSFSKCTDLPLARKKLDI